MSADWVAALQRVDRLTDREREVFLLLVTGESNQQLADRLFVSERTIRAHLDKVRVKLGAPTRLALALASFAHQYRWSGGVAGAGAGRRDTSAGCSRCPRSLAAVDGGPAHP
jgi:DNA-binding CsgD family transcriptional regulator